jgi:hypothetical protein
MTNIIDGEVVERNCDTGEPTYVILTLPLPPSKNRDRAHRYSQRDSKRLYGRFAWEAWLAAGMPKFKAVTITPRFYCWSVRDHDNCIGQAFKGVLDGLKGHLVPDDSPTYLTLGAAECFVDRGRQRLELHIREREVI